MQNITSVKELKYAIQKMEYQHAEQLSALKDEVHQTVENMKPLNLIKSTFKEITTQPDFKTDLIGAGVGLTAGLITKAIVIGVSKSPVKRILGSLLEMGVASVAAKNSDMVRVLVNKVEGFFSKKKENL